MNYPIGYPDNNNNNIPSGLVPSKCGGCGRLWWIEPPPVSVGHCMCCKGKLRYLIASVLSRDEMSDVFNDIQAERAVQKAKAHGGDTDAFDKSLTRNDWVALITSYAGRASTAFRNKHEGQDFRENMVKVAALAVAAIEAHDKGWC